MCSRSLVSSSSSSSSLSSSSSSPLPSLSSSTSTTTSSAETDDDEEEEAVDRVHMEDGGGGGGNEQSEPEIERLRETIDLLNMLIHANAKQYDEMTLRIATLEKEKAEYTTKQTKKRRKRKRVSTSDDTLVVEEEAHEEEEEEEDEDEEEEEDDRERVAKQCTGETHRACNQCHMVWPIENFDRTSARKKAVDGSVRTYYYRRYKCKKCVRDERYSRCKKRLK